MIIEKFFNFISKFHHYKIASYVKNLDCKILIDVGSHKGEDVSYEWSHPHDSMPIANGSNKYASPERIKEIESIIESNPRPEEDMAEWFKIEKPDESDQIEEEKKTIHQKMYDIATSKYNPFSVGGSESIHDFEDAS